MAYRDDDRRRGPRRDHRDDRPRRDDREPRRRRNYDDEYRLITDNQARFLEDKGYDTRHMTFREASDLIDKIKGGGRRQESRRRPNNDRRDRRDDGRSDNCTAKQAKILSDYGQDPSEFTFKQASAYIKRIADRNWPRPEDWERSESRGRDDYDDDDYDDDDYDDDPEFDR